MHAIKKNPNALVVVIKEIGLEEYADKMWRYELCSTVKKAHLLRPKRFASCVSYRGTNKPLEQAGKRTRSAARDTTHSHTHTYTHTHTHTQSPPKVYKVYHIYTKCMALLIQFHTFLVVTLTCELISCFSHSAFFGSKYCCFILASNHIFKNPLQTSDVYSRLSCSALRELSSA